MTVSRCRRCATGLSGPLVDDLTAGTRLASAGSRPGRRCPVCGWLNLAEAGRSVVELDTELGLTEIAPLPTTSDPDAITAALRSARGTVISNLRQLVHESEDGALAFVLTGLKLMRGDLSYREEKLVLAIQQVYACLVMEGPLRVFGPRPSDVDDDWLDRLSRLASLTEQLSMLLREITVGTFTDVELAGGKVQFRSTADTDWAYEVNLNALSAPMEDPLHLWEAVDDVEEMTFGYSARSLLGLLHDPQQLTPITRVRNEDGLVGIDLAPRHPILRALERYLLLSADNWQNRSVPSFMFADPRGGHRSHQAVIAQASDLDWLRYAPLLSGCYGQGTPDERVAITSPALVERCGSRMGSALAGRLAQAEATARRGEPETAREVARLARSIHADFERGAAAACEGAGLDAIAGLEELAGKPLECGEIDVLAVGEGADRPIALVIECKNVDSGFFKDLAVGQAADTMARAAGQARRKAAWVARNWAVLTDVEDSPGDPVVVALVVTRRIAFPPGEAAVPVVPLHELTGVVTSLRSTTPDAWRPDFRSAVTAG